MKTEKEIRQELREIDNFLIESTERRNPIELYELVHQRSALKWVLEEQGEME